MQVGALDKVQGRPAGNSAPRALAADLALALDPVAVACRTGMQPDPWQSLVLRSSAPRLLLNCCRQSGKSTTAAVLAVHRAVFYPDSLVLLLSPSLRQSGELFRKISETLERLPDPPRLVEDNKLSMTLPNGSRVVSLPGSEVTVRGFSAPALVIEDEASRVSDELHAALRPMVAVSGGQIILMSTPLGQRGHFHNLWTEGGEGWERVRITAAECPRISAEFLAEEKRTMGALYYASEYECQFVHAIDAVFAFEDIQAALSTDIEPLFPVIATRATEVPRAPVY